jgi:protocatechuate 3,4-dioxygenase alpha subunit
MNMDLVPTPSQTVGPFFHFGLTTEAHSIQRIARPNAKGERIWVCCRVFDGEGSAVNDAMIEIWQADAEGCYPPPFTPNEKEESALSTKDGPPRDPEFRGFGRLGTREDGSCEFETIKPGRVPSPQPEQNRPSPGTPAPGPDDVRQAPHLEVAVFARGMLKQLYTRMYFAGEPANQEDYVLSLVPEDRRETLMAHLDPSRPGHWRFDIRLQGEEETVFFDV